MDKSGDRPCHDFDVEKAFRLVVVKESMRSGPSLAVVCDAQQTVYLVIDEFGGRMGRSTDEAKAGRAAVIVDLLDGQYKDPVRVVAFNTEGWSRDVSQEIADLIVQE